MVNADFMVSRREGHVAYSWCWGLPEEHGEAYWGC